MFKKAPSSGLDIQEALVVICPHSLKKRNLAEMKLSFDQYFWAGAGKEFRFIKPYKKKSHEVKSGERKHFLF